MSLVFVMAAVVLAPLLSRLCRESRAIWVGCLCELRYLKGKNNDKTQS